MDTQGFTNNRQKVRLAIRRAETTRKLKSIRRGERSF